MIDPSASNLDGGFRGKVVGRRRAGRWCCDPLWPAGAGGRHIPDPRVRQGQLPGVHCWPEGLYDL